VIPAIGSARAVAEVLADQAGVVEALLPAVCCSVRLDGGVEVVQAGRLGAYATGTRASGSARRTRSPGARPVKVSSKPPTAWNSRTGIEELPCADVG
jgi:hypothetical protein